MKIKAGQYYQAPWQGRIIIKLTKPISSGSHFQEPDWEYVVVESSRLLKVVPILIPTDELRHEYKYLKHYDTPLWRVLNEES